ncbi:MAG TPA: hypothetical protein VG347_22085, partial [Verrucomicrobiae bacterium]|nr:hypothetical protein [Verrucomicrobiae bacterium]
MVRELVTRKVVGKGTELKIKNVKLKKAGLSEGLVGLSPIKQTLENINVFGFSFNFRAGFEVVNCFWSMVSESGFVFWRRR